MLVTKCEGNALSLVSLVPRRHGLEAWRVVDISPSFRAASLEQSRVDYVDIFRILQLNPFFVSVGLVFCTQPLITDPFSL